MIYHKQTQGAIDALKENRSWLVLDTETTGFYKGNLSRDHKDQVRLVQISFAEVLDGEIQSKHTYLIKQYLPIPEQATAIHGKTTEMCNTQGIELDDVRKKLQECIRYTIVVAHNAGYDKSVLTVSDINFSAPWLCTMKATEQLCKIPNAKFGGYKWPKLMEAYKHCYGKDFEGAHDAEKDMLACLEIAKYLRNL